MRINLNRIPSKGLEINEAIEFPKEIYQNTDILDLQDGKVKGSIRKDINQDYLLELTLVGTMVLPDARTLEPIEYPFHIEIAEKITETNDEIAEYFEKNQNTLDIMGVLWENIVLEVPMRLISQEQDFEKSGEGWELVSEKSELLDPSLAPLGKLLDIEKE